MLKGGEYMPSIDGLLNKISGFRCVVDGKEIVFPGILQEENGNVILNARFPLEQYQKIRIESDIVILGKVSEAKTTLMGCHIKSASYAIGDSNISIYAVPNEIIVGGCFSSTPMAKKICISTSDLNYMFSGASPLKPNVDISTDNPSVLNYTFPKPIVANDKYGRIQISQSFGTQWAVGFYRHNIISVIEYSFTISLPVMEAVGKVSAARSLFSFFGNGYISFEDITFEIDGDENVYGLWLNYREDIPAVNEPFLIGTSSFENQFQKVWDAWLVLYESANPIPNLFYEIICNRSTKVNGFLNLSQAIEVYSNAFRYDDAKKLAASSKSKREIPLKYIYQDILSAYNSALGLVDANIVDYANGFSNMRNYFTHYNSGKYVEPTYDELFAANYILRFVLLTIVYTAVGIPLDCILNCKKRIIFSRLDYDADVIMQYSKKKK